MYKDFRRPLNKLRLYRFTSWASSSVHWERAHSIKAAETSTLGLAIKLLWPRHEIHKCLYTFYETYLQRSIFIIAFNKVVFGT